MTAPHVDSVKRTRALTTIGLSSLLVGCLLQCPFPAAVRVPARLNSLRCAEIEVDLDFIRADLTGRDEILKNLYCVDVGAPDDAVFWGRWSESSWYKLSGDGASSRRLWNLRNLLIEFDEYGVVVRHRVVSDKELLKEVAPLLGRRTLVSDFSKPVEIPVSHRRQLAGDLGGPLAHGTYAPATLVLGKDYVLFEEPAPGHHNFKVTPTKITRLRQAKLLDREEGDPKFSFLVLHFSRKTPAGRKITFRLHSSNVIPLLKYVISMSPNVKFK